MNSGDTAWMLASSAMVLLMTPGLAFFYGGMVRSKSVLNMMMMSFASMAIVTVLWVFYGYSLAFGNDAGGGLVGNLKHIGLNHITQSTLAGTMPTYVFVAFQLMFAIITVALISGAVADRIKFSAWIVFTIVWITIVYFPVAHWVFDFDGFTSKNDAGGWIANKLHAFDFAGGTAVHINAGAAGLALAIVLRNRVGFRKEAMRPHNLPFVLLGAGLLWFGWYGFNAGSAVASNGLAGLAFINTTAATAAAMVGWILVEFIKEGKGTSLGAASGAVAGLVAITPACGTISPLGSLLLGLIAGAVCAVAVGIKFKLGFDDSLDVVGVHLVGGIVGTLLIGFLCTKGNSGVKGILYGGNADQLGKQFVAAAAVLAYSFILTSIIALIIDKTIGFTVSEEVEVAGIDQSEHLETAYDYTGSSSIAGSHLSTGA